MGDLISREALYKAWDALYETQDANLLIDAMIKAAQDAPAADAEPVRHGRWIDVWIRGVLHHRCTECDSYIEHIWTGSLDFDRCPKCGAKMDAEVKE